MKVMLVTKSYNGCGGAETVIKMVTEALKQRNIKIFSCVLSGKKGADQAKDRSWLDSTTFIWVNCFLRSKLVKKIVHMFALARYSSKVNPDIVIAADEYCVSVASHARRILKNKTKIISWPHISIDIEGKVFEQLKKADFHLAISEGIATQLESSGVDRKNIDIVYNPIDISRDEVIPFNKNNFVFIGRFKERHKQVLHILSAFRELGGDAQLHLIGDGPDRYLYERYVKNNLLVGKVVFHGYQANAWTYIRDNLNGIGAVVLASKKEGLPMVLLEAMGRGVYCISSDCDTGPREIIVSNKNGSLFEVGDINELLRLMRNVVERKSGFDPNEIKKTVTHLKLESYIDKFVKILIKRSSIVNK